MSDQPRLISIDLTHVVHAALAASPPAPTDPASAD